jgi:hypothetical protein
MVTCALCGVVDDEANMDLIFQEDTTYPDYWQCKHDCQAEQESEDETED